MDNILTQETVGWMIGIFATAFIVYRYFKDPQTKLEKASALLKQDIQALKELFVNLRDNHVHTLDIKIDEVIKTQQGLSLQIEKLKTIIEERMPRHGRTN